MRLTRGRVSRAAGEPVVAAPVPAPWRGRVVPQVLVDAEQRAAAVIDQANQRAEAIVAQAERDTQLQRAELLERARQTAQRELAERMVALVAREERTLLEQKERWFGVARVLAERIVGAELTVAPERILNLAEQVLSEVRGARSVTLFASPGDAERLGPLKVDLVPGVPFELDIKADPALSLGSLRLVTDVGTLKADLGEQLDTLVEHLRRSFPA